MGSCHRRSISIPFMSRQSIEVHLIPAGSVPADQAEECLSPGEMERAMRFKDDRHRELWSGYRAALRLLLGAHLGLHANSVPLILDDHGKPCLAPPFGDLHFNLSHSDDLALIAVSNDGPVGVDLEAITRAAGLIECESSFCHEEEFTQLPAEPTPRSIRLLELWTAKEAYLKGIGTGLLTPPQQVRIHWSGAGALATSPDSADGWLIRLEHPLLAGHVAHLCALQPITTVEMVSSLPMRDHRNQPS